MNETLINRASSNREGEMHTHTGLADKCEIQETALSGPVFLMQSWYSGDILDILGNPLESPSS